MTILKAVALVGLFASAAAAHAEFLDRVELNSALVSGFVSHHINTNHNYNEDNYGVGYRFGKSDVMVGYYKNSNSRDSVYAAYEARWHLTQHLQAGFIAGGVTGYKYDVVPFLLPEVVLQVRGLELAVTYAPHVTGLTPALVAGQVRWSWR